MSNVTNIIKIVTKENGILRLSEWPEGYVLFYHGQVVWKSWEEKYNRNTDEIVLKLKCKVKIEIE